MQYQEKPYIVPRCDKPLAIVYQDDDLVVVNKPDLLLSMPGKHPLNCDSVQSRLQDIWPAANLVHRLDLDTSGLLIAGLNKKALAVLSAQFANRQVQKYYIAVVNGLVNDDQGEINLPIASDWDNRPLQKICFEQGKHCLSYFKVLKRDVKRKQTRLQLSPYTGRSHQLRLHCKAIGHPILGCDMYGDEKAFKKAPRLLLHAEYLAFSQPTTGELIEVSALADF